MERKAEDARALKDDARKTLEETFSGLKRKVAEVFTKDWIKEPYDKLSLKFIRRYL